jgi:hypothetical protein
MFFVVEPSDAFFTDVMLVELVDLSGEARVERRAEPWPVVDLSFISPFLSPLSLPLSTAPGLNFR